MRVGQNRKRDANEPKIIAALESIGVVCYRQSGPGLPDLLTFSRGVWLPIEVKAKGGSLTFEQKRTRAVTPYPVVESEAEALALFGVSA